ncbi:flavodoxin domain-containing protein [Nocardioides panaciterrulae]|uniref:Menaquinone-dependent protoporphyrinogen oxidase n=1 Tax=Nocardioides panaciterrulae TaxID=661492 RepID=A0A7Y9JAX1_9ACTN|nr:flavodoxin domain-containing protein [Nocardioides panaciterrulae]NYD42187.1 menaquinone-dependent protoporphyrinogen oxidase [Nocardioides panaciterrulae]
MTVLVAYGSRYGATRAIAERLGETLRAAGLDADVREATARLDARPYDAFVVGSAAYRGSWLRGPVEFVRRHADLLAERPVWLFSSGPLGHARRDDRGRDLLELTRPAEFVELRDTLAPQDLRVFYGALEPGRLRPLDRLIRRLPSGRRWLPAGDFRDWEEIDAWARGIADRLQGTADRSQGA